MPDTPATTPYVYGYARVSTHDQELARQLDALATYHPNEILSERISGTKARRPELDRLRDKVRPGDTVVVESFSRLGRSTKDLIELVQWFAEAGVQIISIKENFESSTPQGMLMLTLFFAFAQFERDLIAQRTREGLASARARGRKGGRPRKPSKDIDLALRMYDSRAHSVQEICRVTGVSKGTLYNRLRNRKSEQE